MRLNEKECFLEHKKAFQNWEEGNIVKSWYDENDILCIKYESGRWWHYKMNGSQLEWW